MSSNAGTSSAPSTRTDTTTQTYLNPTKWRPYRYTPSTKTLNSIPYKHWLREDCLPYEDADLYTVQPKTVHTRFKPYEVTSIPVQVLIRIRGRSRRLRTKSISPVQRDKYEYIPWRRHFLFVIVVIIVLNNPRRFQFTVRRRDRTSQEHEDWTFLFEVTKLFFSKWRLYKDIVIRQL